MAAIVNGINAPPLLGLQSVELKLRPSLPSPEKVPTHVAMGGNFYPEPREELDCQNKCIGPFSKL